MEDVRNLFIGGLWIRRISILILAVLAVCFYLQGKKDPERRKFLKRMIPFSLCIGTGVFFALALVVGGIISTDFSKYFVVFHRIFFNNDLWILDPATDMLINIVPEPFFMDTALRIGILFAVMTLLFLSGNFLLWKRSKAAGKR